MPREYYAVKRRGLAFVARSAEAFIKDSEEADETDRVRSADTYCIMLLAGIFLVLYEGKE